MMKMKIDFFNFVQLFRRSYLSLLFPQNGTSPYFTALRAPATTPSYALLTTGSRVSAPRVLVAIVGDAPCSHVRTHVYVDAICFIL